VADEPAGSICSLPGIKKTQTFSSIRLPDRGCFMSNVFNRLSLFFAQLLFSVVVPPLLIPLIARQRVTRSIVAFCFGRMYGNKYQHIIDSFNGKYGIPMAQGLSKVNEIAGDKISVIVDCGTGTGFVTKQAAEYFPDAKIVAFDLLDSMLGQARHNCKQIAARVIHIKADTFALPLANNSVDLILAQNTIPNFEDFARICRSGGMVIFVDCSAGWVTRLAKRLVEKTKLFKTVLGERVALGFYILAQNH
jgi:SAM-dependent methyltransferase